MGMGNYLCSDTERCVYLDDQDLFDDLSAECPVFNSVAWQSMIDDVRGLLPSSFSNEERTRNGVEIIASNGFYDVGLYHYVDYVVVLVSAKEAGEFAPWRYNPLALANLDETADRLFAKLHKLGHYDMTVRASAWTSIAYYPPDYLAA